MLDISLKMPDAGLPIIGGIADAAGEKDELVGVSRREQGVR